MNTPGPESQAAIHLMRRLICLLAALCGLTASAESGEQPRARPNILLILADDQRWDTIRALGNPEIHTPNLDGLVKRGFHFKNAYCQGSMVPAVCLPSRTMLITGRSLWRIPANPAAITPRPTVPVLPALLNDVGYVTFHTGKPDNTARFANAAFQTNLESGKNPGSASEHAQNVVNFLTTHDGAKPFFVYLAPPVPHDPRVAPAEFTQLYDPAKLTLSKNFLPKHPFDNGDLAIRDELLAPIPRTPEAMRQHLADYYATITHFDHEVGRILETLKTRGWGENTVVIYSSDQGLAVGGRHGLMGKQNLYEHVKPPLILAGPGIPNGQSPALVYLFDLFPTICELADAKTPAVAEGKSLLPIARGETPRVREHLLGAYKHVQRMIRDERWKLLAYHAGGERRTQLFDLQNDPDELHDLAAEPAHAKQRRRLEIMLKQARQEFGDPIDFDSN